MSQVDVVYNDLKSKIEDGWLGDLTEISLSDEFQTSRNTIKKALLMLESEGLIVMEKNRGARVRTYDLNEIDELLEIRENLEGLLMHKLKLSDKDKTDLQAIVKKMKELVNKGDIVEYSKQNHLFHEILYQASTNHTLVQMINEIKKHTRKFSSKTDLVPGRAEQSLLEHEAIMNAVIEDNSTLAEKQIKKHLSNVREKFKRNYQLLK